MTEQLPDGVFFGLDEAVYHAQERLSASGIKNMVVSPLNFWAESWLNPRRRLNEEADWAIFGKAQHKRLCEGKEAFQKAYAPEIHPQDFPDALVKHEQLKAECLRVGAPVSGTKEVLADRLRQFGCQNIWEDIQRSYADTHKGKVLIPRDMVFDIEISAAIAEKDPVISKCFKGGEAEVSVFWTEEIEKDDGSGEIISIRMKSRFDVLKPKAIVDVKTYGNTAGKSIKRAITYEIAARKYGIQTAVYYDAFDNCQRLIRENKVYNPPRESWLKQVAETTDVQFVYVFMQKGPAPVITGWIMPRHLGLISVAKTDVRMAQQKFHDCLATFGADPWVISTPLEMLGDGDIPMWGSE